MSALRRQTPEGTANLREESCESNQQTYDMFTCMANYVGHCANISISPAGVLLDAVQKIQAVDYVRHRTQANCGISYFHCPSYFPVCFKR